MFLQQPIVSNHHTEWYTFDIDLVIRVVLTTTNNYQAGSRAIAAHDVKQYLVHRQQRASSY